MIGPEVLLYLTDYFTRQNVSLDGLLTILHASPTNLLLLIINH